MHIGRLIARLNPTTVRFDVGVGGIPEMTAQDVAFALGTVRDPLGRELLSIAYGDAPPSILRKVDEMLADAQRAEWWGREQSMMNSMLAVAEHRGGDSLRRAQGMYAAAHAKRWPHWIDNAELGTRSEGYARVRLGVLAEIRTPMRCHVCDGRGSHADAAGLIVDCKACRCTGYVAPSNRSRAKLLKIENAPYIRRWKEVYEWTLALSSDRIAKAADEVARALA